MIGSRQRVKKTGKVILTYLHSFVELFFPSSCLVCGRKLTQGEKYMCTACLLDIPLTDTAFHSYEEVLDTFSPKLRPQTLYALFYYDKYGDYKKLIHALKYHSQKELGRYLGRILGDRLAGHISVDGIVPIPLHPKRERKRGYNQSTQIAIGMAEILHVPVMDKVVVRLRNNASQTGKNTEERQLNVENLFCLKEACAVQGKHLLIVDDVITTGATVRACVDVLAEAGEVTFSLACLARTM